MASYPLTKYERARLLACRASQLAHGDPPRVEVPDGVDPWFMARREWDQKKMPCMIRRILPNGKIEHIPTDS